MIFTPSPNAPAVDITFVHFTPYIDVMPMKDTLQVRATETDDVVLIVPNVNLDTDKYDTFYAIGLVGKNPNCKHYSFKLVNSIKNIKQSSMSLCFGFEIQIKIS